MEECNPISIDGKFNDLIRTIMQCKKNKTCPELNVRSYYFEPNSYTIREWIEEDMFKSSIDRRAMFICESPGPQSDDSKDIDRGWSRSRQDKKFHKIKKDHGFDNCYITDMIKCGIRKHSKHSDKEVINCQKYIIKEIELLRPIVAVAVGGNSYHLLRRHLLEVLDYKPILFHITHYSARIKLDNIWQQEFEELKRLLMQLKS